MSLPGRFLDIGGQRVFYHRAGRGKPLVLLHGILVSHYVWRHVIPGLAADHDVIAIDLPGFGESDRPSASDFRYTPTGYLETVIGVLDALGIERATLAGHSMGGGIALYTAARQPDRVERLVVVDPLIYPFTVPVEGRIAMVPYVGPSILRTLYTRSVLRRYMIRDIYLDPALASDEWVDYVWERFNRPGGVEAVHATVRMCADPGPIARVLRAVRAPSLVVWGEQDRLFPVSQARQLHADLPGSQLVIVPRCGHSPAEERPADLLRAMTAFLQPAGESARRAGISAVPS